MDVQNESIECTELQCGMELHIQKNFQSGIGGSLLVIVQLTCNTLLTAAVPSTLTGTLVLTNQPAKNELTAFPFNLPSFSLDNRTGIAPGGDTPLGESSTEPLLTCTAGHHGDELVNYSPPSVVWVRNGQAVDDTDSRITLNSITMAN